MCVCVCGCVCGCVCVKGIIFRQHAVYNLLARVPCSWTETYCFERGLSDSCNLPVATGNFYQHHVWLCSKHWIVYMRRQTNKAFLFLQAGNTTGIHGISLIVCLSVCLPVCLSVSVSVYLYMHVSVLIGRSGK